MTEDADVKTDWQIGDIAEAKINLSSIVIGPTGRSPRIAIKQGCTAMVDRVVRAYGKTLLQIEGCSRLWKASKFVKVVKKPVHG